MNRSEDHIRDYRNRVKTGELTGFSVRKEQTDLFIRAEKDLYSKALDLVIEGRALIEDQAKREPDFLTSLSPLPIPGVCPPLVRDMYQAGARTGVGPMAAVAGAMAEYVGLGLMEYSPAGLAVENGGDIFLFGPGDMVVGLYAGDSPLSMRLGVRLVFEGAPFGICTSSGTIGHSLSLGGSDAATVISRNAALADAAATALGNRIKDAEDMEEALNWALSIEGIQGAVIIIGDKIGLLGDISIEPI